MNTPLPHPSIDLLQLADILTEIRARALDLDHALDLDLRLAAARARNLDLAVAFVLDRARALNLNLNLNLARAFNLALVLARDLDLASDRALDIPVGDLVRDFARDLARDLDLARDRVRELATVTGRAHAQVVELLYAVSDERDQGLAGKSTVVVARAAGKLAVVAAWLQPAGERTRYGEEFAAELWDLTQAGAGRCQQVLHAIRLLAVGWQLRRELKAPRRTKAAP